MKTSYSLKNFRIFDSEGATFEIAPITILTGCNSSGKSSVTKSMVLLKEYFAQIQRKHREEGVFDPFSCNLDFANSESRLGTFEKVLNNRARRNKTFSIGYEIQPLASSVPFVVEITFGGRESDFFNAAWPTEIRIRQESDEILHAKNSKGKTEITKLSFSKGVLDAFVRFYLYYCRYNAAGEQAWYESEGAYSANAEEAMELCALCRKRAGINYEEDEGQRYKTVFDQKGLIQVKKNLFGPPLAKALESYVYTGVMFYFPIFDLLRGKTKAEIRQILEEKIGNLEKEKANRTAILPEFHENRVKQQLDCIMADFEKCEEEDFLRYYQSIERKEMENMADEVKRYGSPLVEEDFGKKVGSLARISFSDWGDVHFGYKRRSGDDRIVNFNQLYNFFGLLQWTRNNDVDYIEKDRDGKPFVHKLYSAFIEYVDLLVAEVLDPPFFEKIWYVGNTYTTVNRLYTFDDERNNMVSAIKRYFSNKNRLDVLRSAAHFTMGEAYEPGTFTNKWLRELSMGDRLEIENVDGLGFKLLLKKSETEKEGHFLADEGYGYTQLVSFLLHIDAEIVAHSVSLEAGRLQGMLPGGSQPYIESPTLIIEEPEAGLHPKLQSKLADVLFDAYENFGIHFIIETHSEYLIRRFQNLVSELTMSSNMDFIKSISMYYVNANTASDSDRKYWKIEMNDDGCLQTPFGKGFLDEADRLARNLFTLKLKR